MQRAMPPGRFDAFSSRANAAMVQVDLAIGSASTGPAVQMELTFHY
jgi:hypothetical protein